MAKHILEIGRRGKKLKIESTPNLNDNPLFSRMKFTIEDENSNENEIVIDNSECQNLINYFMSLLPSEEKEEINNSECNT